MSTDTHADAPTSTESGRPRFALASLLGPAILAGTPYRVGDHVTHAEYGRLEVRGFGESNGARGAFVLLRPPDVDADVGGADAGDGVGRPVRWSLDRGAPQSLPDAYAAGDLTLDDGTDADPEIRTDGGTDLDWPDCIRCGSRETTVVPKTGEWTCEECGCQWTPDETPVDDGDADAIPGDIERAVRALASMGRPRSDRHRVDGGADGGD